MELNTSQPEHSTIMSRPSRNPILLIAAGIFLIAVVGLGLLVWQKNQEISGVLQQLSDSEKRFTDQVKKAQVAQTGGDLKDESTLGGLTELYHQAYANESTRTAPHIVTIKYLDEDHTYARVHVEFVSTDASKPKNTLTGKFDYYIFKSVTKNDQKEWVMLAQNPKSEEVINLLKTVYGVPADVLDLTKEKSA